MRAAFAREGCARAVLQLLCSTAGAAWGQREAGVQSACEQRWGSVRAAFSSAEVV